MVQCISINSAQRDAACTLLSSRLRQYMLSWVTQTQQVSRDRNVRQQPYFLMKSDIYIRVCGVLQGVISSFPSFWELWWGISLARWLWQSLSQELSWHCEGQGGSTGCLGHRTSPNSTEVLQQSNCTEQGAKLSLAENCWSWQHWSEPCSLRYHSSWYNGDNVIGKWTAATSKKDTEKMRRQLEVPVQSGQVL